MGPGAVAHFTDGQKAHTGVVLDVSEDGDAWTLFLTSNPHWNKRCRPLTLDELTLCGFAKKDDRQTYFAPVVRPSQDAYPSDVTFPDHRVLDLVEEFGPSPFLPPAISLPAEIFPPVKRQRSSFSSVPLSRYVDRAIAKLGGVHDWDKADSHRLGRVAWGLDDLPRSELMQLCAMLPGLTEFFTRRPSVSLSLQSRWAKIGAVLGDYREKRGVPGPLMARRMGVTDREYRAFENGLLCPSHNEMLTIMAMLPGIPDEWTLPTSVPLLADCLLVQMRRRRWFTDNVSSKLRIPLHRVNEILIDIQKPTEPEMKKLRTIFQDLPPWRPLYLELDGLCPVSDSKVVCPRQ
jgi:hypothetical protein